jgi:hypothetical protein
MPLQSGLFNTRPNNKNTTYYLFIADFDKQLKRKEPYGNGCCECRTRAARGGGHYLAAQTPP